MSRFALHCTVLALVAGHAAAPLPATAQCRLCQAPTTELAGPGRSGDVQLTIETSLDFDRLVLLGSGEGTAVLHPNGSRSVSGVVGDLSGRAMVGSASVSGEPGRAVRIDLPRTIQLNSLSGGQVVMDDIVSDLPATPRLDSAGRLNFRFGGRLRVTGDAEGDYRGDLRITVEYL